ncbi:hypothetical protein CCY99_05875 [Helicobacter sp. 16-1353]|uniref:hypothetical protein n=1 Tax=Helicobacter sp. 16-1353 TaxID=2004996 RepID=UPI000DCE2A30|nr:hypothetical protein [Helicobacter sp. 16-1353]RAX53118.1 hypothetical protein CCY99_05875 [Helicobacter sp. 16-1353]
MKRQAFGMIFAIIITVLVATLAILGLKLSTSTLNTTTNEHIAIQLDLYLNSTAELAILYIQRNGFKYQEGSTTTVRPNVMEPIIKNINYGANGEYQFTYKMTPLVSPDVTNVGGVAITDEQKNTIINTMILDISGFVVSPITNQTFRVTKRQVVKP